MLPRKTALLDPSESKLYTLVTLEVLGECSEYDLTVFLVENDIMSAIDFSLAVSELVSDGCCSMRLSEKVRYYAITPVGVETLQYFRSRLPHSKVERLIESAPRYRTDIEGRNTVPARYYRMASGDFEVVLQLREHEKEMAEFRLCVPDEAAAHQIVALWPVHASSIYQYIMQLFSENIK